EQVRAYGRLAVRPARWWAELARVLADDGQAVVLIPDTADLAAAIGHGLRPAMVQQVSLFGAQPYIVRLVPARSLRRRWPRGRFYAGVPGSAARAVRGAVRGSARTRAVRVVPRGASSLSRASASPRVG